MSMTDLHREPVAEDVCGCWYLNTNSVHRVGSRVAKALLLKSHILARGQFWDIKGKSVGAGVWEMHLVPKEYK
jgi:hypothetical protein